MLPEHITKRESVPGRWLPIAFYLINVALWVLAGISAAAWNRLWLVVVTLPALVLYVLRTRRGHDGS
jgi:fatty acid desaturase